MTKTTLVIPLDAESPDWDHYPEEEVDGVHKFKVHIEPQLMTHKLVKKTVLQAGNKYFLLNKMKPVAETPTHPPKIPFHVWGKRVI